MDYRAALPTELLDNDMRKDEHNDARLHSQEDVGNEMRFYQLHRTHEAGTSSGYQYFASLREAQMACTHWCRDKQLEHDAEIKIIDIEPTKRSILYALNRYASHADNG